MVSPCIFFGSAAENAMTNWISGYMENALNIDKALGDILGMAMFAIMLGVVRICYAKWGKRIFRILFVGMVGATACYLVAGLSTHPAPAIIACILAGAFTSMLWPGNLVVASSKFPTGGVFIYAMMAAGGDLGASIAPQLVGIITDGDIRRAMESRQSAFFDIRPMDIATREPKCISPDSKLIEAEREMTQHKVNSLLVVDGEGCLVGVIQIYDIKL